MTLNSASADVVAQNICTALGVSDTPTINNWKKIMEQIWSGIVSDAVVTLEPDTVITVGSPATQTGPQTPVVLTVS